MPRLELTSEMTPQQRGKELLKEQLRMERAHGKDKAHQMFFDIYGQAGVDDVFDYIMSCATPENYEAAAAEGRGGYVVPLD